MAEAELPGDGDTPPLSLPPRQSLPPPGDAVDVVGGVRRERRRFTIFGYKSFVRLWAAQLISSLGDWIGLFAVLALAARIGKSSPETAVGVVMIARMIPGFFLASVGGVLVDRWSRKKVMVTCDIGRGLVMASLPFCHTIWQLRPGAGDGLIAVLPHHLATVPRLAAARDPEPALDAGQGGVGPQPRSPRSADDGQLPVAGRRLRHVPPRRRHLRPPVQGCRVGQPPLQRSALPQ